MTRANEEYRRWMATAAKPAKYKARPTEVDGIRFASVKEANHYCRLKLLQKLGKISGLELQPRFPLRIGLVTICTYVADFSHVEDGKRIITECKGYWTREAKLKTKLFLALYHDLELRIV